MVSIITSLNKSVQNVLMKAIEKQKTRKALLSICAVAVFLFLGNFGFSQTAPTFTVCPGFPGLILPAGDGGLTLNSSNIPSLLGVTAVDPDGAETITYSASPSSITCADIGPGFSIAITATDSDGTDVCNITVDIFDGGPFANCNDITVELDAGGMYTLDAADEMALSAGSSACTGIASVTVSQDMFNCTDIGAPIQVTVTVEDNNTATAFCLANITVVDDPPVAACVAPFNLPLDGSGNASITTGDIDNGSTEGSCSAGGPSLSLNTMDFDCMDIGPNTVTLTVTDDFGQTATCSTTVTVQDNDPPVANCNNITVALDASGNYTLTASDLSDLSSGSTDNCSFTTSSSQTSFDCSDVPSAVTVTVTVSDGTNSDNCMADITVEDNIAPTVNTCPADITVSNDAGNCSAVVNYATPTFDDNCGGTGQTGSLTMGLASGSAFQLGTTTVTYTFTDAGGTDVICTFDVTVNDTEAPSIDNDPGNQAQNNAASQCEATVSWPTITGSDNCPGTVTVTYDAEDPKGNSITILTAGGNDFADFPVGESTVNYELEDANGNTTPGSFLVNIVDNEAPSIICPPATDIFFSDCNAANEMVPDFRGNASINDNCTGFSVTQSPAPGTLLSAISTPADGEMFNVMLTVTDGFANNLSDNCSFTVTLNQDDAPQPTISGAVLPTITSDCGPLTIDAPTAVDECGNLICGEPFPGGIANQVGPACGAGVGPCVPIVETNTTRVTLPDNTPGGITSTINIPAGSNGIIEDVNVSLEITHTWVGDLRITLESPNGTVVELQDRPGSPATNFGFGCAQDNQNVTFDDELGTSTVENICNTSFTGFDNPGPPYAIEGTFDSESPLAAFISETTAGDWILTVSDNASGDFGFLEGWEIEICTSAGSNTVSQYEFPVGTHNITWVYDDGSGNTSSQLQTIDLSEDTEAPMFSCNNTTVTLDASGNGSITATDIYGLAGATDNCTDVADLLVNLSQSNFDCSDVGIQSVTLNVTDLAPNPNTGMCTVNVTVVDDTDPVLMNVPGDVLGVDCNSIPTVPNNVTATDACGIDDVVFNSSSTQSGDPTSCNYYNYTITRTWTALDVNANQSVGSQTITVIDVTAPSSPTFSAATNVANGGTISVDAASCEATVILEITDFVDCADFSVLNITNNVNGGGADASDSYGLGMHTVQFTATDPCGNNSNWNYSFTVVDNVAPVASCVNQLNLGLPASGLLVLNPNAVDNNSFDDCSLVTVTVSPDSFDCDDVGIPQTVTLEAMDAAGNTSTCITTVNIQENNPPTAIGQSITVYLDENGMATITADQINNGSFDDCTDVSLSASPTTFTDADLGPNPVTLTVTDENGNSSNTTVTVTVALPPTCFNIGIASGGAGEIVSVPVTSEDFTALVGFQFELQFTNEDAGEFVGISNINPDLTNTIQENLIVTDSFISQIDSMIVTGSMGQDSTVFDTTYTDNFDKMSISWNQFNTDGMGGLLPVSYPDGTVLFYLDIQLTGNIGDFTIINVNSGSGTTPPQVVYSFGSGFIPSPACINQGAVTIGELIISGEIFNEDGNSINLVDVDLFQPPAPNPVQSDQTMTDGEYSFTISAMGTFVIEPSKNINWSNGIDIVDVSLIQRHSVGNPYVNSAYKKIAADVSGEGSITTFDAVLLNSFIASLFMDTPPPTPSWQFVDAKQTLANDPNAFVPSFNNTITLVNISSDSTGNDFIAVKTGDLGGIQTADTTMFGGNSDHRFDESLKFMIEDRELKAGEQISIDLTAENFNELIAYQWILEFNPEVLTYTGFDNVNLVNLGELGFGKVVINEGKLVLTWANATEISKKTEDVIFSLNFEVNQDARLRDLLKVTPHERLQPVAYRTDETPMNVELNFVQPEVPASEFVLNQNTPNPFKEETAISFSLPEASTATLTIMDITGRILKQYEGEFAQGYNVISINRNDLPSSGTLLYELKTPEHTASKKMIIID